MVVNNFFNSEDEPEYRRFIFFYSILSNKKYAILINSANANKNNSILRKNQLIIKINFIKHFIQYKINFIKLIINFIDFLFGILKNTYYICSVNLFLLNGNCESYPGIVNCKSKNCK